MELLKNTINNNIFLDKDIKNQNNTLINGVKYTINNISQQDLIYYDIFQYLLINIENKIPKKTLDKFITSFYSHYTAYQNIYNLPSMINNKTYNNKKSTHIKFNQAISYLSSLTLINESFKLLITLDISNKDELLKIKRDETDVNININVLNNFGNITTHIIKQDNDILKLNILVYLIKSTLLLLNIKYQYLMEKKEKIIDISKQIILNPDDFKNIINPFIREISIIN